MMGIFRHLPDRSVHLSLAGVLLFITAMLIITKAPTGLWERADAVESLQIYFGFAILGLILFISSKIVAEDACRTRIRSRVRFRNLHGGAYSEAEQVHDTNVLWTIRYWLCAELVALLFTGAMFSIYSYAKLKYEEAPEPRTYGCLSLGTIGSIYFCGGLLLMTIEDWWERNRNCFEQKLS